MKVIKGHELLLPWTEGNLRKLELGHWLSDPRNHERLAEAPFDQSRLGRILAWMEDGDILLSPGPIEDTDQATLSKVLIILANGGFVSSSVREMFAPEVAARIARCWGAKALFRRSSWRKAVIGNPVRLERERQRYPGAFDHLAKAVAERPWGDWPVEDFSRVCLDALAPFFGRDAWKLYQ